MDTVSTKWAIFAAASIVMLYLSRGSFRNPEAHGFPRFFAWESTLALVLVNSRSWFENPFSPLQIVSWFLLGLSLVLVSGGLYLLVVQGRPTRQRVDPALMDFEKTSRLVTTGVYRYIRHPLYGSIILLAWGAYLKDVTLISSGMAALATVTSIATARADEVECIRYFGQQYVEYMKGTKMFVPFLL
jgi:protein-S-isoprenylcysteine O-methyltransferase Ste14